MRLVVACTVFLPPPYDSLPAEWSLVAGDHGALAFAVVVIIVEDDPIARFLESMGQGAVREQGGIMTGASLCMEDRQPGFVLWIEAVRRNALQSAGLDAFAILDRKSVV